MGWRSAIGEDCCSCLVMLDLFRHPCMSKLQYYVYILASKKFGTLYIGMTRDLIKRVWEHQSDLVESFTKKYIVHTLVYFEVFDDIEYALKREKQLKNWKRDWKINVIERENPGWVDLYPNLVKNY